MKAIRYRSPGGLSKLGIVEIANPGLPAPHEIRVRMHASSLNRHDYNVALGILPVEDGRILMSDGAGIVEAVGIGIIDFAVGDQSFPHSSGLAARRCTASNIRPDARRWSRRLWD